MMKITIFQALTLLAEKYKKSSNDAGVTVIVSTASPFKFPRSINKALSFADSNASEFKMVQELSMKLDIKIPKGIDGLEKKEILHKSTCRKDEMKDEIKKFLGV